MSGRNDDNSQFGRQSTYAAAYGYQINPHWRAHASYGTSFKAPSLYQFYALPYGNPLLQPEAGRNHEAAIIWDTGSPMVSATYF